jgi:hypothetical protein
MKAAEERFFVPDDGPQNDKMSGTHIALPE